MAAEMSPILPSSHQRSIGELRLGLGTRDGATVLRDLYHMGCLKARFPRPDGDGWYGTVLLNTAGGVAGGDTLTQAITVELGASAWITTQAAERIYRALPDSPPARLTTTLNVASGAALEWLPQETILFNHAHLRRELRIDVADNAHFLGVETLIFGRTAMGETLTAGRVVDRWHLSRAGRLLLHDTLRLEGDIAATLARRATGGGCRAAAILVMVAPPAAAEAACATFRATVTDFAVEAGASAWNGIMVARLIATNSAALRAALAACLTVLRQGRPLPRMWSA